MDPGDRFDSHCCRGVRRRYRIDSRSVSKWRRVVLFRMSASRVGGLHSAGSVSWPVHRPGAEPQAPRPLRRLTAPHFAAEDLRCDTVGRVGLHGGRNVGVDLAGDVGAAVREAVAGFADHLGDTAFSPASGKVARTCPSASSCSVIASGTAEYRRTQRIRFASSARSGPAPLALHFRYRRSAPSPSTNVTPPSSLTHTGLMGRPPATSRTSDGTTTSSGGCCPSTNQDCTKRADPGVDLA